MATKALGTNATTSLTALVEGSGNSAADIASVALAIKDDRINGNPIWPGAYSLNGRLYIPNRGSILILPGDYVGVDNVGWPILVSAYSIANGAWTHS